MIEYPEAFTLARQMAKELTGRKVASCIRGNTPHKFAWYNLEKDEYEQKTIGKTVGNTLNKYSLILTDLGDQLFLALGEGGEKIRLHDKNAELPKKHQLLLGFDDGKHLSVAISGWGMASLFTSKEIENHTYLSKFKADPLSEGFTFSIFKGMIKSQKKNPSVKYFLVSEPGISGIGNGMCQEILFEAKLHAKTKIKSLTEDDIARLHNACVGIITKACELGGRDTETDLYGNPGGYNAIMNAKNLGAPCPNCGTQIERIAWLGGNCYFCPSCQKPK
jgi:formamidopyrimidine-DNA glycosylase